MKIGYPCINRTIGCTTNRTFRLKSYSEEHLIATVLNNLTCLYSILLYNIRHNILFFRISSDLVPFASHPVCTFNWQHYFEIEFKKLGDLIRENNIRVSMHPDQFILINSKDEEVYKRSCQELLYHAEVLDLLGVDKASKIQIHVGGVYGNKQKSLERFIDRYNQLDEKIKNRLVIENDDQRYTLRDCLYISSVTAIPVVFDVLHHQVNNSGEELEQALNLIYATWSEDDGLPIIDYSLQKKGERKGKHAESIDMTLFKRFLMLSKKYNFDIMLEIKDKEKSVLKALHSAKKDSRLIISHRSQVTRLLPKAADL